MSVILISEEGKEHKLTVPAASCSRVLKSIIDGDTDPNAVHRIPIPKASARTLMYCQVFFMHAIMKPIPKIKRPLSSPREEDHLTENIRRLFRNQDGTYDPSTLIALLNVAWFLDAPDLIDVCMVKLLCFKHGKSAHEVRTMFGIPKCPVDVEYELRKNNVWIFNLAEDEARRLMEAQRPDEEEDAVAQPPHPPAAAEEEDDDVDDMEEL